HPLLRARRRALARPSGGGGIPSPKAICPSRARGAALGTVLVIVSRRRPDLYPQIRRLLADPRYQLMFDRRRVVRRRTRKGAAASERRRRDRRTRPEIDEEIRVQGWAVVAPHPQQ